MSKTGSSPEADGIETSFHRASAAAVHPAQQVSPEGTMNANQDVKSRIERQLSSIHMSEDRRQQVLHDIGIAESIVAAVEWICGKFKRPNADVFAKPSPKY